MNNEQLFSNITKAVKDLETSGAIVKVIYTNLPKSIDNTLDSHCEMFISPNADEIMGLCAFTKIKTGELIFKVKSPLNSGTLDIVRNSDNIIDSFSGQTIRNISFTNDTGISGITHKNGTAWAYSLIFIKYKYIT